MRLNVYRITTSDWEKARVLGFVLYIERISIAKVDVKLLRSEIHGVVKVARGRT